jgi:hypothetical protein
VTGEGIPPKRLEARILEWIRERTSDPALREQLEGVRVLEREATGAGYYVTLAPREEAPATAERYGQRGPFDGPCFECPALPHGGGLTLLWFEAGRVDCLEIAGHGGDEFPVDPDELGEVELSECVYPVSPVFRDRARKLLARRENSPTFLGLLRRSTRWKVPVTLTCFLLSAIAWELGSKIGAAAIVGVWLGVQLRDLRVIASGLATWPFLESVIDWEKVRRMAGEETGPDEADD